MHAANTLACYNACVLGRRIIKIRRWWDATRNTKSLVKWLQEILPDLCLTKTDIYRYTSLGKLQEVYPKLIFVTVVAWQLIAAYPSYFHSFVADSSPSDRLFWSSASTAMVLRTSSRAPPTVAFKLSREGSEQAQQFGNDNEFQELMDLDNDAEAKLKQLEQEDSQLLDDIANDK